jgi:hypothetical protein
MTDWWKARSSLLWTLLLPHHPTWKQMQWTWMHFRAARPYLVHKALETGAEHRRALAISSQRLSELLWLQA